MVTDNEGGFFGTPKFVAQPLVDTKSPQQQALEFMLFPNPASETVQLAFGQGLDAKTQVLLLDLAGRQMGHWSLGTGESSLSMRVAELPKGVYFVAVRNERGMGLKKLVVF